MIAEGIIYRRTPEKLKITINVDPDENQDFQDLKVNIILKWNEVTYRRYFQILQLLENPYENINVQLADLFFRGTCREYQPKHPETFIC